MSSAARSACPSRPSTAGGSLRGAGTQRSARAEVAAGRKHQTEAGRRRFDLGQGHAPGRDPKKVLKPARQREVMQYLVGRYGVSTRRACRVVPTTRSSTYDRSRKDPLPALRLRMRELAQARVRFGYRRLRVLMQREGWEIGKERFIGSIPRKAWRYDASGPGATPRPCIASSVDPPSHGMTSGAWTSSPTSSPMAGDSGR